MRVVLKPISHPELGDVVVEDDLFAVGRREQPFSSMEGDRAAKLSRRHARIFLEGGGAHIVDLGSTNGTQVNGTLLGTEPADLHDGDEIVFGGEISFRAEIVDGADDATVVAEAPAARLVLNPVNEGFDPVVVESFPFLVSRNDAWVKRYQEDHPADVKEISRRHALIVLKGSRLYVEDLDSANGTYVSGTRLDELAHALNDGDTLAFGTSRFAYTVQLDFSQSDRTVLACGADGDATNFNRPPQPAPAPAPSTVSEAASAPVAPVAPVEDGYPSHPEPAPAAPRASAQDVSAVYANPKTIYLNANPTSFVNEVYAHEPVEEEPGAEAQGEAKGSGGRAVGRIAKARAVSHELGQALETGPRTGRRITFGVLALLVVAGAIYGTNYWLGGDRRQVESLLDDQAYAASAAAADGYLAAHPDDEDVESWGTRALVNAVVPEWLRLVQAGDFPAASESVRRAGDDHPNLRDGAEFLALLEWSTRLEAHMAERARGPISLFEQEQIVRGIVDDWDADPYAHRRLMGQLADLVPAFEPAEARLMSALRTLQNDSSLYLKAISELQSTIGKSLDGGNVEEIGPLVREFEVRFPKVSGTQPLLDDLARYQVLQGLVRQRDLLGIQAFRRNQEMATPVFSRHVDAWLDEILPPAEVIARFEQASDLWRAGDLEGALAIYQPLTQTAWSDLAESDIDRMQSIMAGFQRLQGVRDDPAFAQRLLEFRQQLKPGRDDYFVQALQADIEQEEQALLVGLGRSADVARSEWETFDRGGGIPSVLRVQDNVSDRYRAQAARLANALAAIVEATDGYQLTDAQPPADWLALRADIVNEILRQRRALEELKRVMDPALVESKLALMPNLEEATP